MSTREAYPNLLAALDEVRRRWRLYAVTEGVLWTLAGVVCVLLVTVTADNLLQPERLGRWLLAMLLWGSFAAALLTWVVHRVLEDRRDDFFAALVEQQHPELRNLLINALQLGRGNQAGFSPRMIEAIVHDAAEATAELDLPASVDSRRLGRAGLCAVAVLLLGGIFASPLTPWVTNGVVRLLAPTSFATVGGMDRLANGMVRVLLPFADVAPYSATHVVVKQDQESARVPEGEPVIVEARVEGVLPASARLHYRSDAERWESAPTPPEAGRGDTFRFTFASQHSFDFHVSAGDGISRRFHVEVVKRPQIESLAIGYAPPAYTGQAAATPALLEGDLSGIPGTTVNLQLKATKPLQEARLLIDGKPGKDVLPLSCAEDERAWRGSFVLWTATAKPESAPPGQLLSDPRQYQVELVDTEGFRNVSPLRAINLGKDAPPVVEFLAPARDLQVKPGTVIPLSVKATDDHGVAEVRIFYRINEEMIVRELARFPHDALNEAQTHDRYDWNLATGGVKAGDRVVYWATAADHNNVTGPGRTESRTFTLYLTAPEEAVAKLDIAIHDYAAVLEELVRLQRENRAQTASGFAAQALALRQTQIRTRTRQLARAMEKDALPVSTLVKALDDLVAGLLATAVQLLESARDTADVAKVTELRNQSLPIQDQIIAELEALLARLQRNEQAKEALRKIEKKDKPAYQAITKTLAQLIKDLDGLLKDQTELAGKFEKLPKKESDELKEEKLKAMKELEELKKRAEEWAKGTVNELTKLPTGFVDDFKLRHDVNKVYEEIEKAATRGKAEKMEVSLEDLGASLATKMKEDLEMWLPDSPDATKWVLEEPLNKKPMKIPEMPLPKALEDLVGDLLQKAEEFDQDADDITSAWGDNLDQAGWGVSDGPISSFSAKGKTGNDFPNSNEVTGRSGDGRRGKSAGQMVGDTARGLQGRKTPARVGNEKYEPGQLKQEGQEDPNGATGGGKKAGAGRKGLQGGTPPDMVRDMGRLSARQAGLREKAEQVAQKLDTVGIASQRLAESIKLMKSVEEDLRDQRYDDAARKRREALAKLQQAFSGVDQSTAAQLNRARDLPPQLRQELLQAADEGYPAGYESLLKSYFKALSTAEK